MRMFVWLTLLLTGVGFCTYSLMLPGSEVINNLRLAIGAGIIVGTAAWWWVIFMTESYLRNVGAAGAAGMGILAAVVTAFGFGTWYAYTNLGVMWIAYAASLLVTIGVCCWLLCPAHDKEVGKQRCEFGILCIMIGLVSIVDFFVNFVIYATTNRQEDYTRTANWWVTLIIGMIFVIAGFANVATAASFDPPEKSPTS